MHLNSQEKLFILFSCRRQLCPKDEICGPCIWWSCHWSDDIQNHSSWRFQV